MSQRRLPPLAFAAAVFLLSLAGCARLSNGIPHADLSNADNYGAPAFRDEAPANARLQAADFPLSFVDSDGRPVDLAQYRHRKKVVLVVLRGMPQSPGGVFCSSCLAQTTSLLANQDEFTRRGAEVMVVFPGPTERLGEFLQAARNQTPGEPERGFRLLLDRECSACDRLGIRADLAKPATYVVDTRGNVVYAFVGETSTDRPSVKAVLAQLDKAD